jgi:hypothetical protein
VHGHAVDQGVETFRELPQRSVAVRLGRQLPLFGQFGEGAGDVGGSQVREAFGDPVDIGGRDAEGEAGVPQGAAGPVGLGHGGDGDPFLAELVEDRVVALQASGGFHVDVDVGQGRPAHAQEAFEQQAVVKRVRGGDVQCVADHRSGARAAGRDPDAVGPDVGDDLADGEEIGVVVQLGDHLEFSVQPVERGISSSAPTRTCLRGTSTPVPSSATRFPR